MEAMDSRSFCKPLQLRMANTVFDWNSFCFEGFPTEVFSGQLWNVNEALARGIVDEDQKAILDESPDRFKDFHVIITSSFNLEEATSFLPEKIPFYSELAMLVVDPASLDC